MYVTTWVVVKCQTICCREIRLTTWICDPVRSNWIVQTRKHHVAGNSLHQEAIKVTLLSSLKLSLYSGDRLSCKHTRLYSFYLFANNGVLLAGIAAWASVYIRWSLKWYIHILHSHLLSFSILRSIINFRYFNKQEVNGIDECADRIFNLKKW